METSSKLWKKNKDQVQSAVQLLNNYCDINIMFSIENNGITAIAFSIEKLIDLIGSKAVEVGIDAT
ncbi:3242_t:CDS:1, partial [Gigaspora rosea]